LLRGTEQALRITTTSRPGICTVTGLAQRVRVYHLGELDVGAVRGERQVKRRAKAIVRARELGLLKSKH
jgi:hypothetical protein